METLRDHQQHFLDKLEVNGKSFNTIKNYRTDLKCFNDYLEANQKNTILNEFTDTQIKEYARYIEQKYNSPNSRRRRIQALRIFFDYLVENGHFPENPIRKVISSPKVVEIPNPVPFNLVQRLYHYLDDQYRSHQGVVSLLHLRNKILLHLIYGAGLKVSDIQILKNHHFSKGADNIYRVLIAHPKRDPYTIPFSETFNPVYETYLELLKDQKSHDRMEFDDVLFNANPFKILSGGLSPRGCELIFEEFSHVIDFKITPRSFRQSCIFKWLGQNKKESTIKEWMGVRPVYSLAPYKNVLSEDPEKYVFLELSDDKI